MNVASLGPARFSRPPGCALAPPLEPPSVCLDRVELSGASPNGGRHWARAGLLLASALPSLAGLVATVAVPRAAQAQELSRDWVMPALGKGLDWHDHHGGNWDRRTTAGGWEIPRNLDPSPVKPAFALEVPRGLADQGRVQVLDNTRGRIQALRLQWPAENDPRVRKAHEAMFTDLLSKLDPDVRFEVVAEGGGAEALRALIQKLPHPERVHIHSLSLSSSREQWVQGMSMWSRDSSVTLTRASDGQEILLLPRSFRGDGTVDAYLNRVIVQSSGAAPASLASEVTVRRSELNFEGGDVLANGRHVALSGETIRENARELGRTPDQVKAAFEREFGRQVLVIDPEPDFHLDMGIGFLDDHTVTVGSPALAEQLLEGSTDSELESMRAVTRDKGLAARYDAAAETLTQAGYRVIRLPNLAGRSLSTPYLSYHNVLLENYHDAAGHSIKRVYLPAYGIEATDRAARQAYAAEGFQVIEIPAARESTRLAGAVRCAVSELEVAN